MLNINIFTECLFTLEETHLDIVSRSMIGKLVVKLLEVSRSAIVTKFAAESIMLSLLMTVWISSIFLFAARYVLV
jgi:hypothetical protein